MSILARLSSLAAPKLHRCDIHASHQQLLQLSVSLGRGPTTHGLGARSVEVPLALECRRPSLFKCSVSSFLLTFLLNPRSSCFVTQSPEVLLSRAGRCIYFFPAPLTRMHDVRAAHAAECM